MEGSKYRYQVPSIKKLTNCVDKNVNTHFELLIGPSDIFAHPYNTIVKPRYKHTSQQDEVTKSIKYNCKSAINKLVNRERMRRGRDN
jgi:hypothetical protein